MQAQGGASWEGLGRGKNGHSGPPHNGPHPDTGAKCDRDSKPGIPPRLPGRPDLSFLGGEWLLTTHSLSPMSVLLGLAGLENALVAGGHACTLPAAPRASNTS